VGLVGAAQYINEVAMAHWELFAAKPYFTKNGFFVSVIFSFPLLLLAVVITVRIPSPSAQLTPSPLHTTRHDQLHDTTRTSCVKKEGQISDIPPGVADQLPGDVVRDDGQTEGCAAAREAQGPAQEGQLK
jgi:hypothetical protein